MRYRPEDHPPLDDETTARWMRLFHQEQTTYPMLIGLMMEEVRNGYCRMRLPFREELLQSGGAVHGGAIASLLDTVVVPVVGGPLSPGAIYSTVDFHVQYLRAVLAGDAAEDMVAEGVAVKRGKRTVFCEAEAYGVETGDVIARSVLTYAVLKP